MKLTWAVLALTSANDEGEDKKYVNKPNFMNSATPAWWTSLPAEKRAKSYFKKTPQTKFLSVWNLEADSVAWESKFELLDGMRRRLNKTIKEGRCGRDAQAAVDAGESNDRKRRSIIDLLEAADSDVDTAALDEAEEAGQLAPRKVKGNDLKTDINKMYGNMARYVLEEVLKTPVGKRCHRMGYKMLYKIERIRVASQYMYCRKADKNVYPKDDMCNFNTETKKPRWRITKKGEMAGHPRGDHFKYFDWSEDKLGQEFPQEE